MLETFFYTPTTAGEPADIDADGGEVLELRLYPDVDRGTVAVATVTAPARQADLSWRFDFDFPGDPGRYYAAVDLKFTSAGSTVTDKTLHLDLPTRYDLLCSAEEVAVRLGVALPITAVQRERIEAEIINAQADVLRYVNRPLGRTRRTFTEQCPALGWALTDYRAWPAISGEADDIIEVVSATETPADSGIYDVVVQIGLNLRAEPAVRRYVLASAAETLRLDPNSGLGVRAVTSVSAEGQSISYEKAQTAQKDQTPAGALPALGSLAGLRRTTAFRRRGASPTPWPYSG